MEAKKLARPLGKLAFHLWHPPPHLQSDLKHGIKSPEQRPIGTSSDFQADIPLLAYKLEVLFSLLSRHGCLINRFDEQQVILMVLSLNKSKTQLMVFKSDILDAQMVSA